VLRGGASTRFHPKRRASMDHNPGPNIARASPMVPKNSGVDRIATRVSTCKTEINATDVPAIGVQRPRIKSIPETSRNAEIISEVVEALLDSVELARNTNATPAIRRNKSRPAPGQPPANVEYSRRIRTHNQPLECHVATTNKAPKGGLVLTLLGDAGLNHPDQS